MGEKDLLSNAGLFYSLVGFSVLLALILLFLLCRCLWKQRKQEEPVKTIPPKLSITSRATLDYTTELKPQPSPVEFHIPQIQRKHSGSSTDSHPGAGFFTFDPKAFDVDQYIAEEQERARLSPLLGLGRLSFAVYYNRFEEALIVTIHRARKLASKSNLQTRSYFVKCYLLPDKKRKLQTRTRKGDHPDFSEEFIIPLPEAEIDTRILKFVVFEHDRFPRTQILGYVYFPLRESADQIVTSEGTGEMWKEIVDDESSPGDGKGDLLLSLQYLPTAARITVQVIKGREIYVHEKDSHGVLAVKVSLISAGKPIKTKKATARQGDISYPVFNDTFVFDTPNEHMDRISFIFAVCIYPSRGKSKKVLGRIIIGSEMFATGDGVKHWNEMIYYSRNTVSHWHSIL